MSVLQIKTTLGFNELLNAIDQLDTSDLETLTSKVIGLRAKRKKHCCTEQEGELLLKINQPLPIKTQQRLNALCFKRQTEQLNHTEQQELITLTETIEQADAERLLLIEELAKLRGLTFEQTVRSLGIETPEYA